MVRKDIFLSLPPKDLVSVLPMVKVSTTFHQHLMKEAALQTLDRAGHGRREWRVAAAISFIQLSDETDIHELCRRFSDEDGDIRFAAEEAFKAVRQTEFHHANSAIGGCLQDHSTRVRQSALVALANLAPKDQNAVADHIPKIIVSLTYHEEIDEDSDEDSPEQQLAAVALSQLGERGASALVDSYNKGNSSTRKVCFAGLMECGRIGVLAMLPLMQDIANNGRLRDAVENLQDNENDKKKTLDMLINIVSLIEATKTDGESFDAINAMRNSGEGSGSVCTIL